jgi:hypothetical protein
MIENPLLLFIGSPLMAIYALKAVCGPINVSAGGYSTLKLLKKSY